MHIDNSILKGYLGHVYFITGNAYAGKSTIAKMLSERCGVRHCEENYGLDKFLTIATPQKFPNLCYFKTMRDWQAFVTRSADDYAAWLENTARELSQFEVVELLSLPSDKPVIVDTNIPLDILCEIADYDHVAVMLADPRMSVERFFERDDPEKKFLLKEINKTENPEATLENFKEALAKANSQEQYNMFEKSGFKVFKRDDGNFDIENRYQAILRHFGLENARTNFENNA